MIAQKIESVDFFDESRAFFEQTITWLEADDTALLDHYDLEVELEQRGHELMRRLLQAHINVRGPGDLGPSLIGGDGLHRTHKRPTQRKLETIFGTVCVGRTAYHAPGYESLHPKDASLNLPEQKQSHHLTKRVALEVARGSYEEAITSINQNTGAHIAKRQAEELAVRAAQDFDSFYQTRAFCQSDNPQKTGPILVFSSDGKGIAMKHEDLRPVTKRAAEEARTKKDKSKRLRPGEKKNRKRMACVGSVYTIARHVRTPEEVVGELRPVKEVKTKQRPKPENKRVWASIKKSRREVVRELFDEAEARDPKAEKEWVGVLDGDPHQLADLQVEAEARGARVTFVLDLIHVLEYIWEAARALKGQGTKEAELWAQEQLLGLLKGKCSLVAAGIRRSATHKGLKGTQRKAVDKCCNYLLKNKELMRYDEYLKRGYPIASGVIEGACRSLVQDRMGRTGARWRLDSAEAVLRLRALLQSGDFEEYWEFHMLCEYQDNHAFHFNEPPRLGMKPQIPSQRRHLRVVK